MIMDPIATSCINIGGATNPLLHAAAPTDAKSDVAVLVVDITSELG